MKKKPVRPVPPVRAAGGGGYQAPPAPARKPPPRPAARAPGGGGYQQPPAAKKKTVKRKLALGEAVACCAAEALAASLRLAGWPVTDADVLALYELTAGDEDEGATILATLEAAAEHGLAGIRPIAWTGDRAPGPFAPPACSLAHCQPTALILGADLPGPHALCDDGAAWWSWGRPYGPAAFPGVVIEEAWVITWPS